MSTTATATSRTQAERACRIPSPRLPTAPPDDRLSTLRSKGANPMLVNSLGHAVEPFVGWYQYFGQLIHYGAVRPDVKEAARLRIAALNDCHFCLHTRASDRAGKQILDETLAEPAQQGALDHPGFDEQQRVALVIAEQMFRDPGSLADETLGEIRGIFSDEQFVELGLAIAQYIGMGRLFKLVGLTGTIVIPHPEAEPA